MSSLSSMSPTLYTARRAARGPNELNGASRPVARRNYLNAKPFRGNYVRMTIERWVSWVVVSLGLGLGLGLGGCSSGDGDSGGSGGPDEPEDLSSLVRAAVDRSLGNGLATSYSVAVWKDGEVVYAE